MNDHSEACRCVVCQLARAVEGATEEDDRASQKLMAASWQGFADEVAETLEEAT